MRDKIRSELFKLEEEHPIHVVNARERGSRMLGVVHDGSDYDVMFLFAQDAAQYAKLDGHIDSIHDPERGENGLIDLHGWNIDKFAQLAADSNPNAVEYCRPDAKEYITHHDGGAFDAVCRELRENFNHMSLYYHYTSMAKSNYKKYVESGKECTINRQFHVARALACAQHIRKDGTLPPMNVDTLLNYGSLNEPLAQLLDELATEKRSGYVDDEIEDFVGEYYSAESEVPVEPTDERISQPDRSVIDDFIGLSVVR